MSRSRKFQQSVERIAALKAQAEAEAAELENQTSTEAEESAPAKKQKAAKKEKSSAPGKKEKSSAPAKKQKAAKKEKSSAPAKKEKAAKKEKVAQQENTPSLSASEIKAVQKVFDQVVGKDSDATNLFIKLVSERSADFYRELKRKQHYVNKEQIADCVTKAFHDIPTLLTNNEEVN